MTKEQSMDVRNINVPVLLVVSIVAFFIWATSFMMNERTALHDSLRIEIRRLDDRMLSIDRELGRLQNSVIKMRDTSAELKDVLDTRAEVIMSVCENLKKDNPTMKCVGSNGKRN